MSVEESMVAWTMTKEYVRMNMTRADIERVIDLKYNKKLTWKVVAERLGYNQASLENLMTRYRTGHYKFQYERGNDELDRYLAMRLNGDTIEAIATKYETSKSRVHIVLTRAGWDSETINEERERGP